jgi:hypothetical protein
MKKPEAYYEVMLADKARGAEAAALCAEKDDLEIAKTLFVRVAEVMEGNPTPELVVMFIAVMVHDIRAGEAVRRERAEKLSDHNCC